MTSDDLRTRSEGLRLGSAREEGAEQPESFARTVQMITPKQRQQTRESVPSDSEHSLAAKRMSGIAAKTGSHAPRTCHCRFIDVHVNV